MHRRSPSCFSKSKSIPDHKVCKKKDCHLSGKMQPIGNFYSDKSHRDEHQSICKKCVSERHRKKVEAINKPKRVIADHGTYYDTMSTGYQRQIFNNASRRIIGGE